VTAFRSAAPLLAVTLVNKIASIAISLLPALVVAMALPAGESSAVVGFAKGAAVVGTLSSGGLADRFGPKPVLVASIAVAGVGALGMAASTGAVALGVSAAITMAGLACFPVLNRMVIAASVPVSEQREALAWLRTTANLGLVASFALGGTLGSHVTALLVLDGAMSLVAAGLGAALLPAARPPATVATGGASTVGPFLWMTALICGWGFAYEGFLTAVAAILRDELGPSGVSVFSWVMVTNTVGCALLGVAVATRIAVPDRTVPLGFALLAVGAALGVTGTSATAFGGILLATAGELLFSATAQFVWMSLTPQGPNKSSWFAAGMTLSFLARAAGGAVVFPLVVHGAWPGFAMAAMVVPGFLFALGGRRAWEAFRAAGGIR
jgi:MFS family permease